MNKNQKDKQRYLDEGISLLGYLRQSIGVEGYYTYYFSQFYTEWMDLLEFVNMIFRSVLDDLPLNEPVRDILFYPPASDEEIVKLWEGSNEGIVSDETIRRDAMQDNPRQIFWRMIYKHAVDNFTIYRKRITEKCGDNRIDKEYIEKNAVERQYVENAVAVRNVIVHQASVADTILLEKSSKRYTPGKRIKISLENFFDEVGFLPIIAARFDNHIRRTENLPCNMTSAPWRSQDEIEQMDALGYSKDLPFYKQCLKWVKEEAKKAG